MAVHDMPLTLGDIDPDRELPPQSLRLTKAMFGIGDVRTIHNDDEAAQREGLPGAIAVGPQVASLIFRMMRVAFGQGWIGAGKMALTFRRPISSEAFITARGRIVSKRPEGESIRVECEVWIEILEGSRVVVGSASALVPFGSADQKKAS